MTRPRALHDPFYDDEAMRGGFFAGLGELIAAYPSIAGGSAAFAVIFGFVASNALWYQPGKHPAPILQTRPLENAEFVQAEAENPIRQAVQTQASIDPQSSASADITTFRIERDDNPPTGSIPVPLARPQSSNVAAPVVAALPETVDSEPSADPLLKDIQALLKHKGFYGGDVDGLIGPMSQAAIRNWQKRAGLEVTGQPSEAVLESLRIGGRPQSIAPRNQPAVTEAAPQPIAVPVEPVTRDPIAETIAPQAAAPLISEPVAQLAGASELVRRIQSGLANIAYADIAVDGVAGLQTKEAISAFEKHYRLPVTGEPNDQVLQKLVEIGAL